MIMVWTRFGWIHHFWQSHAIDSAFFVWMLYFFSIFVCFFHFGITLNQYSNQRVHTYAVGDCLFPLSYKNAARLTHKSCGKATEKDSSTLINSFACGTVENGREENMKKIGKRISRSWQFSAAFCSKQEIQIVNKSCVYVQKETNFPQMQSIPWWWLVVVKL